MKHTPGPWAGYFQDAHGEIHNKTWTLVARPGVKPTPILIAGIFDSVPSPENARLISKAPEMYVLLQRCLGALGYGEDNAPLVREIEAVLAEVTDA